MFRHRPSKSAQTMFAPSIIELGLFYTLTFGVPRRVRLSASNRGLHLVFLKLS